MKRLTAKEEEAMALFWEKGPLFVKEMLAFYADPKPHFNTLSTVVRGLEEKGFVSHKAYGRTYEYYPAVDTDSYTRLYMSTVLDNFFEGSVSRMVNFFSSQKSISVEETDEILRILNSGK